MLIRLLKRIKTTFFRFITNGVRHYFAFSTHLSRTLLVQPSSVVRPSIHHFQRSSLRLMVHWSVTRRKCVDDILQRIGEIFLAHRIRISEILPWDIKSYLTLSILLRTSINVSMCNCIKAYSGASGSLF